MTNSELIDLIKKMYWERLEMGDHKAAEVLRRDFVDENGCSLIDGESILKKPKKE